MKNFESHCSVNANNEQSLFLSEAKYVTIGDVCDIGNGLVSGMDKAFQLNGEKITDKEKEYQLKVIKAKDLRPFYFENITNYIFLNEIEDEDILIKNFPNYYKKLQLFKENLKNRYQYNNNIPYWKWVFLRNYNLFKTDKDRIFVPCKERISNKDYFRFAYAGKEYFPTQDVTAIFIKESTKESIFYLLSFLNNYRIFQWLLYNGIVKGSIVEFSERPIASIPFRKIDWKNKAEVELHDKIVDFTKKYITNHQESYLKEINNNLDILLGANNGKL